MSSCPVCQTEITATVPGRLCDRCAVEIVARDHYQPADLRFVGVLAGILGAALLSMPGAVLGYYLGQLWNRASPGSAAGVVVMSLVGLVAGFTVGPRFCLRMEAARRIQE